MVDHDKPSGVPSPILRDSQSLVSPFALSVGYELSPLNYPFAHCRTSTIFRFVHRCSVVSLFVVVFLGSDFPIFLLHHDTSGPSLGRPSSVLVVPDGSSSTFMILCVGNDFYVSGDGSLTPSLERERQGLVSEFVTEGNRFGSGVGQPFPRTLYIKGPQSGLPVPYLDP